MPPPSCGDVFFYYGRKEKKYKKKLLTKITPLITPWGWIANSVLHA
jgi:hypothetical protein